MIESLVVALILIAIVSLVIWGIASIVPMPAPVKTIVYVIGGIICLLILLRALTGSTSLLGGEFRNGSIYFANMAPIQHPAFAGRLLAHEEAVDEVARQRDDSAGSSFLEVHHVGA